MDMRKYRELSKNTILFSISSFGSRFLTFFLVPLYTLSLTTYEYGVLDLINTSVQLLIPILTFNIQDAVLRYCLDKKYEPKQVITIAFSLILASSIFFIVILWILVIFNLFSLSNSYIIFLFISYLMGIINNCLTMYLKGKNKVALLAFFGLLNTMVTFTCSIILLLWLNLGVQGYMISFISGTVIANIGMFIFGKVYKDIKITYLSPKLARVMLLYSTPLVANSIGWWINNASDRYILAFYESAAITGIYAISYKIPSILSAVQSVFYNAWSVSAISEYDKNDTDGFIGSVFNLYSIFSIMVCSLIMLFNTNIAHALYAKDFYSAWKTVPFLLVGTTFNGLGLFIGCIFTAVKNTKIISFTTVIGAIINTILNLLLIPIIGVTGAAIATLLGYFFIFIFRVINLRKIMFLKLNWKKLFFCITTILGQSILGSVFENMIFQLPFFILLIVIIKSDILTFINLTKSKIRRK